MLPLSAWQRHELEDAYDALANATSVARGVGRYALAAQLLALRGEVSEVIRAQLIEAETYKARQLSLAPPGAYDVA